MKDLKKQNLFKEKKKKKHNRKKYLEKGVYI